MSLGKVTVRVPATTANLGPGFDCLGMALDIYNTVVVEPGDSFGISVFGEGAEIIPQTQENQVYQGLSAFYERVGESIPQLQITCHNEIPLRRGLGSSAAAIVSGLVAANYLCQEPFSLEQLICLAAELEGHPDNVAPAVLGGCQVVVLYNGSVVTAPILLPAGLKAVLFIPDFEMPTEEARLVLPQQVSRVDAVFNIGRAALLVAAFTSQKLESLRVATQDKLHQLPRQALFPAMGTIFDAALSAGALGVFLSGGGSTILALTQSEGMAIAEAMARAASQAEIGGKARVAQPSPVGACIV